MTEPVTRIPSSTRDVSLELSTLLRSLKEGQRIRVTQTVRVGFDQWTTTVEGTFRYLRFLATGLATDRVPEDDVVVPTVHFTKDNGELASIAIDQRTRVEAVT